MNEHTATAGRQAIPDFQKWFEGKDFRSDMLGDKILPWFEHLAPLRQSTAPLAILECGAFEGRSTIALLEMFPRALVTSIDQFTLEGGEERFDKNTRPFGKRLTKIKGRAVPEMDRLRRTRQKFDLIYLDAGKRRDDSMVQSVSGWSLLNIGGFMIWDDLRWGERNKTDPAERPGPAINLFASAFASCLIEVHRGRQLIIKKVSEWPL